MSPRTLPPLSPPKPQADGPIPPAEGNDTEIAPHLVGLVIVGTPEEVNEQGAGEKVPSKAEKHVRFVSGVKPEDQKGLQAVFDSYLGKPITLHRLNEMLREIVLYYRRQDRPVVDAYLPEQDMVDDVVQIVVTEAKQGKVSVEENNWFSTSLIESKIRSKEGDPLRSRSINADVAWINRNPFSQTQLVYTPGEEEGTTDIVLKVEDRFPVRPYVGYEDSGNLLTGYDRYIGGFNWGNALFLGDLFNYQFMSSGDFDMLKAHSGSYIHYFPWHHQLTVFGSYADTKANINTGATDSTLTSQGDAWQASMRYAIPLPGFKAPWGTFTHEAVVGYDFKESSSLLLYNVQNVSGSNDTMADVSQFMGEYDGSLSDPLGATSFDAQWYYSPGEMMDNNTNVNFLANNASGARYQYAKFSLNRVSRLPFNFTFIAKAEYQWANQRLIGSEQMGMGGYDTVRGYDDREANGDEGFFLSGELRSPSIGLGHFVDPDFQSDQLQLLIFTDYGGVSQFRAHDLSYDGTATADNPNINMWSIGTGCRYSLSPFVSFRFDYGWQLLDSGVASNYRTGYASRGHIGVTISY